MTEKPIYPFVIALYGSRDDEKMGDYIRPQDFGNRQRWHYNYIEITRDDPVPGVFQAHIYTEYELQRNEDRLRDELFTLAARLIASGVPDYSNPYANPHGLPPMAPTDCLQEDDFWVDEWGDPPPFCDEEIE